MTRVALRIVLTVVGLGLATTTLAATDIEREARAIKDLLMAPCCFQQQVSVHQSPTAKAWSAASQRRDTIPSPPQDTHQPAQP